MFKENIEVIKNTFQEYIRKVPVCESKKNLFYPASAIYGCNSFDSGRKSKAKME